MMVPVVVAAVPQPVVMQEVQQREQLQVLAPQVVLQMAVRLPLLQQEKAVHPLVDLLAQPVERPQDLAPLVLEMPVQLAMLARPMKTIGLQTGAIRCPRVMPRSCSAWAGTHRPRLPWKRSLLRRTASVPVSSSRFLAKTQHPSS